jgi:hypothetical protein
MFSMQSFQGTGQSGEKQPLIKSMGHPLMGKICFLSVGAALVVTWCAMDKLNHDTSMELSVVSEVKGETIDPQTGTIIPSKEQHNFPLTLAFFQFACMAIFFAVAWLLTSRQKTEDVAQMRGNVFSMPWGSLVVTHVFSTFWLQSLMMPKQLLSPLTFAASRAAEVPAAAVLRSQVIGAPYGGHAPLATALMTGAGMLLIYSQMQLAECFCIWSGSGVELAGVAMVLIYAMVLILPAANAVCMESIMVKRDANPLLMLATMNILACVCFAPILMFGHVSGWENVVTAVTWIASSPQLTMLVCWLCIQMICFSAVNCAMIGMFDSFWAVALHSFKAVYWWLEKLVRVYLFSEVILSIEKPNTSFWGFVMLCGMILVGVASVIDATTTISDPGMDKSQEMKV